MRSTLTMSHDAHTYTTPLVAPMMMDDHGVTTEHPARMKHRETLRLLL